MGNLMYIEDLINHKPLKKPKFFGFRGIITLVVTILLFIGVIVIRIIYITPENYNLIHIPMEFFSIFIAWTIFAIAWNSRRFSDNNYFLFIGISFLFIGAIDFIHTLVYKGLIVDFSNWATQTWIVARYIHAITYIVSIIFIGRRVFTKTTFLVYFLISSSLLTAIFTGRFPVCYNDVLGQLTPFKIYSEYVIIAILIISIMLIFIKREKLDNFMVRMIVLAILFTIFSEYAFTLYTDVTGIANLIGHLLKIVSFYFIYVAMIEYSLEKPYDSLFRSLAKSEKNYRGIFENSPIALKEENLSDIRRYINNLKQMGVDDIRSYFNDHPEDVRKCASLVKTLMVNRDYLNLYKATSIDQFTSGLSNIFIDESYEVFKDELVALAEGKLFFESETTTKTLEGNKNYIYFRLLVVPGYEETLARVLISVLDRTAQFEFETLRRQFIFTVSHELRTPISVISQSISNLQKHKHQLTQEQESEIVRSLSQNTALLTELVEDLLLLSILDQETIQLNWQIYNLSEVLFEVISQLNPRIKAKTITIHTSIDDHVQLLGDAKRIAQIFRIFIDNAIKYSSKHTKIEIKAIDHYLGKHNPYGIDAILIQFIDEGCGIREEDVPHLFQRFFRSSDVSTIPGTGLGLSIAKGLAQLHQGDTYVESTYGKGSTFSVYLPKLKSPPPAPDKQ